jgi:hypothetical protein
MVANYFRVFRNNKTIEVDDGAMLSSFSSLQHYHNEKGDDNLLLSPFSL